MDFAVGILSFNHPLITARCVRSVLKLIAPTKITLFHHGTLIQHRETLMSEFPQVNHLVTEENKGFSGGSNTLLHHLFKKHEWVYFLTNDTEVLNLGDLPGKPGFYAPLIWRRKIGVMDSIGAGFIPREQKLYHLKNIEAWESDPSLRYIPGTAFLLHRNVWEKVGEFDESLHTYWEDVDFSMRVLKTGELMKPHLKFELVHAIGKTCHKDPFYTRELFQRNKAIISERYKALPPPAAVN
jgi:GT2 family glycosyltransferase